MSDLDTKLHEAGDVTPLLTDYDDIRRRGRRRRMSQQIAGGSAVLGVTVAILIGVTSLVPTGVTIGPVGTVEVGGSIDAWTRLPDPPGPARDTPRLLADGDLVALVGGTDPATGRVVDRVAILDLDSRTWTTLPPLPVDTNFSPDAMFADGRLVIDVDDRFYAMVAPWTAWESLGGPAGVEGTILEHVDADHVVVRGLPDGTAQPLVVHDGDRWRPTTAYEGSIAASSILVSDRLVVVGGATATSRDDQARAAVLDLPSLTWTDLPDVPMPAMRQPTLGVRDGRVFVVGGADARPGLGFQESSPPRAGKDSDGGSGSDIPGASPTTPTPVPTITATTTCDDNGCEGSATATSEGVASGRVFGGAVLDLTTRTWTTLDTSAVTFGDGEIFVDAETVTPDGYLTANYHPWELVVDPDTMQVTSSVVLAEPLPLRVVDGDMLGVPAWSGDAFIRGETGWDRVFRFVGDQRRGSELPWERDHLVDAIAGDALVTFGGASYAPTSDDLGRAVTRRTWHDDAWLLDLARLRPEP